MAVIRNTAAMRLRGKVGNTTYYTQGRRQLARVSENSSNYGESARRSYNQQARRVKWANLVQFYRQAASVLYGSFETRKASQSNYNKFMSKNISAARINLTKEQAERGCCIADAFMISEGSLPHVQVTIGESSINTTLRLLTETEGKLYSVASLSKAILDANPLLTEGMQLTLISCGSANGSATFPLLDFHALELTLSLSNTDLVDKYFGIVECVNTRGVLTFNNLSTDGYYAVIISDSTTGKLRTSTATLVGGDTEMAELFADKAHEDAAIVSYGLDANVFLDSGSPAIFE